MYNIFFLWPYTAALAFSYFCFLIYTGFKAKLILYIGLLPLIALAVFRGDVGTDTVSYYFMVDAMRGEFNFFFIEPGFTFLTLVLSFLFVNNEVIVRIYSLLFGLLAMFFIHRANYSEVKFLFIFFVPVFFISYSMNVVRIGLASMFLMHALISYRVNSRGFFIFLFFSILFHVSAIFIALLLLLNHLKFGILKLKYTILCIGLSVIAFFSYDLVLPRLIIYEYAPSPSFFSGLSQVIILMVMVLGVILSGLPSKYKIFLCLISVSLLFIFFIIARFSYAGLRFLDLLTLAFPMMVISSYYRLKIEISQSVWTSFLISGFLGAIFFMENALSSYGLFDAPWIPYETIF